HPGNILIHNNSVKVSDFGISKLTTEPSIALLKLAGALEYSDPIFLKKMGKYSRNKSSDIYSIGILFWQISSGRCPYRLKNFEDEFDILTFIISGNREDPIIGTPIDY
ncbi:13894_t:CDS:1, partial [Acaulospora morrowiae]